MEPTTDSSLSIFVTGAASELGCETLHQLRARGHRVTGLVQDQDEAKVVSSAGGVPLLVDVTSTDELISALHVSQPQVVLNLLPQAANTLLHDGHAWKDYDQLLPAATSALVEAAEVVPVQLVVHGSYAFLYGDARGATEGDAQSAPANDPVFVAAIEAERLLRNSKIPVCVLRLGFLYGPQSEDLKKYIKSFELHRPYLAGPEGKVASMLHFEDAARALVLVTERQPVGEVYNVADDQPVWFGDFIDHFSEQLGKGKPGHIPVFLEPVARIIITREQMELLELSTAVESRKLRDELGWRPRYGNYIDGIAQTLKTWQADGSRQ